MGFLPHKFVLEKNTEEFDRCRVGHLENLKREEVEIQRQVAAGERPPVSE